MTTFKGIITEFSYTEIRGQIIDKNGEITETPFVIYIEQDLREKGRPPQINIEIKDTTEMIRKIFGIQ